MTNNDNGYDEKSSKIKQLAGVPLPEMVDYFSNAKSDINNSAPNIAPYVLTSSLKAINFLNDKLPKEKVEMFQKKSLPTSKSQQTQWLKIYDIVNNPLSILDHVSTGQITNDQLQALQSVYPDLHNEMKTQLLEELGQRRGENISYSKKIAISKFIGQPIDSTLSLESFQAILNTAGQSEPANQPEPPKKTGTQAQMKARNKVVDLYKTPGQASLIDKNKSRGA